MKISEQWLREWTPVRLNIRDLASRLTLAGIEVGNIARVLPSLHRVVVGRILEIRPHPQADRLNICRVKTGSSDTLDIVCGAANAAVGIHVPTALDGATLPNGTPVRRTVVRGVESAGMLCSAAELGLEEQSTGLLLLDSGIRPGTEMDRVLGLDDHTIEVELTPNRGDCLSIAGLAREIAALTGVRPTPPTGTHMPVKSRRRIKIHLGAPKACAHYTGRVIEGIDRTAATPLWLKERLRRSGLRSIHPVVDCTNYVMLELGQPMHAFDLDALSGRISARFARRGEKLELLDGRNLELADEDLVIADERGPVALAGIMGGQMTAVTEATQSIFLESAWFNPDVIALRSRHYGIHSESSHRFERGVDPALARRALDRAARMIMEICGGRAGPATESKARPQLPKRKLIRLRAPQLVRILGKALPGSQVASILKRLGMQVTAMKGGWKVVPPSWRFDVAREIDLVEEVARVHGYENLPSSPIVVPIRAPAIPESRIGVNRIRSVLVDRDYQEAITYSFVDPELQGRLFPGQHALTLANPIASDLAQMRLSLWPGLIRCIEYNRNRQTDRIRLFEIGRRYLASASTPIEERAVVSGALTGPVVPKQWGTKPRNADFFDAKADLEALLALTGRRYQFRPTAHSALHPGRSAEVVSSETQQSVGLLGELHPNIAAIIGLDYSVIVFELDLDELESANFPEVRAVSRFPTVTRDLAVVVEEAISAHQVLECIRNAAKGLLTNLELFDEYRGEGIDSGRKSLALGLTFQDTSRTLNEEDVETVVGRVIEALRTGVGGQLRK